MFGVRVCMFGVQVCIWCLFTKALSGSVWISLPGSLCRASADN